jgi:hypothetical protein
MMSAGIRQTDYEIPMKTQFRPMEIQSRDMQFQPERLHSWIYPSTRLFMKPQTKPFIVVIKPSRRIDNKRVVRPLAAVPAGSHKTGETPKPADR